MVGGRKRMGLAPTLDAGRRLPATGAGGPHGCQSRRPRAGRREPGPPGRAEPPHPRPSRAGLRGGARRRLVRRSPRRRRLRRRAWRRRPPDGVRGARRLGAAPPGPVRRVRLPPRHRPRLRAQPDRSEEHTSELQSQFHLVCRLLLEKKKHNYNTKFYTKKKKKYTHYTTKVTLE